MPSISYFAPRFTSRLPPDSFESPSTNASKKRKRDNFSSEAGFDTPALGKKVSQVSATSTHLVLSHDIANEQETFRQALEESLQGSNFGHRFPHRSQISSHSKAGEEIVHELATLKPPLYCAKGPSDGVQTSLSGAPGIRQCHLAAMTTTLQKCLLEGDHIRAGRAWGLLLRTENNGHTMDLRSNDRWGVGAEILLRRDVELAQKRMDGRMSNLYDVIELDQARGRWFSLEGFEKAKDYYERLVLQYPYRKLAPNAIGPLDFYLAMFGLWIYSVNEQHSVGLKRISKPTDRNEHDSRRAEHGTESESESEAASTSDMELELRYSQDREQVRKITLQRAQEVAIRLAELLVSPPYTNSDRLKTLQEMVDLWIKDLSTEDATSAMPSENGSDLIEEDRNSTVEDSGH